MLSLCADFLRKNQRSLRVSKQNLIFILYYLQKWIVCNYYQMTRLLIAIFKYLQLNTLTLLESLVCRFAHNGLQGPSLIKVVKEIPTLISEQDLQIALIAITFITSKHYTLKYTLLKQLGSGQAHNRVGEEVGRELENWESSHPRISLICKYRKPPFHEPSEGRKNRFSLLWFLFLGRRVRKTHQVGPYCLVPTPALFWIQP